MRGDSELEIQRAQSIRAPTIQAIHSAKLNEVAFRAIAKWPQVKNACCGGMDGAE